MGEEIFDCQVDCTKDGPSKQAGMAFVQKLTGTRWSQLSHSSK
jgi:hypothetical protein